MSVSETGKKAVDLSQNCSHTDILSLAGLGVRSYLYDAAHAAKLVWRRSTERAAARLQLNLPE